MPSISIARARHPAAVLSAVLAFTLGAGGLCGRAAALETIETPYLATAVAAGTLPPVSERLPKVPRVITFDGDLEPGRHGGDIQMLIGSGRDVRYLVIYGYARLVGYDRDLELVPDILEGVEVDGERTFTLKLRPGHRWSDGHPFTSEDFRYWWEDVANNPELSPAGPPRVLLVDEQPPKVEFPDPYTVRYGWVKPNPLFLASLAGPSELFIYRPAHYLKRFHAKYADAASLEAQVSATRQRSWASLHNYLDSMYRLENPELPTLQPWVNKTRMPASRFIAERNPYFHRVDSNGRQLPYANRVIMTQAAPALIPAKVAAGEVDLQARYLAFNNFTFLKRGEAQGGYRTLLWQTGNGAHIALYPNLNHQDPAWRELFRDVRFRRALSLAIDRELINQSLYFGLARAGNNTVLPASPLYRPEFAERWAQYDPVQANRLLDGIGLKRREGEAFRRLPDGRLLELIVETAGEDTEQSDVLQLVADDWREIGVKLFTKLSQREVFRNRVFAGQTQVSVWSGWDNGIPTADMSPAELAPTTQVGLQWPKWGQFYETNGKVGEAVDEPAAAELLSLYEAWLQSSRRDRRREIWQQMLRIHAEEQFVIGIVRGVPQPVVVRSTLRNVPDEAVYSWDPGAHFGLYRPDTFWFE